MATLGETYVVTASAGLDAPHLRIIPLITTDLKGRLFKGCQEPIQGWYSSENLKKVESTTISYEWTSQASTTIATLLYPYSPTNNRHDTIAATMLPVPTHNGLAFKVTTPVGEDFIMFATSPGLKSFGPYQTEH